MNALPSGTAPFLGTDIDGSTRLMPQHPEAMTAACQVFAAMGAVHDRERAERLPA